MQLRVVLPELARQMVKDFDWASKAPSVFLDEALTDYAEILNYALEISLLTESYPDIEREAAKAIKAFLQGHETRLGLKERLMAILSAYREKAEEDELSSWLF